MSWLLLASAAATGGNSVGHIFSSIVPWVTRRRMTRGFVRMAIFVKRSLTGPRHSSLQLSSKMMTTSAADGNILPRPRQVLGETSKVLEGRPLAPFDGDDADVRLVLKRAMANCEDSHDPGPPLLDDGEEEEEDSAFPLIGNAQSWTTSAAHKKVWIRPRA